MISSLVVVAVLLGALLGLARSHVVEVGAASAGLGLVASAVAGPIGALAALAAHQAAFVAVGVAAEGERPAAPARRRPA